MAMMPKRVKFRKSMRNKMKGNATRGNFVAFGEYGLMSLDEAWLSGREIEAGRVAAQRTIGAEGRLYVRVFPDKPISKKPLETRMGHGKAEPEYYAAVVRPGKVMFEIGGVTETLARQALNAVAHKLQMKTKMVHRRKVVG